MAEGFAKALGGDRLTIASSGLEASAVRPEAIATMAVEDVPLTIKVLCGQPSVILIQEVLRGGHDLVIKTAAGPDESADACRARLLVELPDAMQGAEQTARDQAAGMTDLFGGVTGQGAAAAASRPVTPMSSRERLEGEKETLGLYFSGHPIEDYLDELRQFRSSAISELRAGRQTQIVAGLVVSMRVLRSRRGGAMAFVVLDDRSGRIEASLFPEVYERVRHKVVKDAVLVAEGEVQPDDYTGDLKLRVEQVHSISEARQRFSEGLEIDCGASAGGDLPARLRRTLGPYRVPEAGCPVLVRLAVSVPPGRRARGRIRLGRDWLVAPSDELLAGLRAEFGSDRVSLCYGPD